VTRKNRIRTATRLCATCGTPFTWTSRNPRRRFCDPACKARWWRAANTATATPGPSDDTTHATAAVTSTASTARTANAVTHEYDPYVAGYRSEQTPSAVQNCPNCNQPVAVINLLVTSTAAYVNTPSRTVTNIS
jgi:endogenous inhibitor of DNA gyrase (YacG/DUF329 family)